MLVMQLMLNGTMLDDQHIAWASDVEKQFGNEHPTNFKDVTALTRGGNLNTTLKVNPPAPLPVPCTNTVRRKG